MKKNILFILVFIFGCVSQEDMIHINNRLTHLENQGMNVNTTHKQITTKFEAQESKINEIHESLKILENKFREQYAGVKASSNNSRHEIRQISGRLEEIEYHLKQKLNSNKLSMKQIPEYTSQDKYNLKERIERIELYLGLEPYVKKEEATAHVQDTKVNEEEQLYLSAKKYFDSGDSETARIQFTNFLKKYSKSNNADNAQFWIAEIYYKDKWYEKAILEYQKVIEDYPDGDKVSAALLKQGMSFLLLDDKTNASLIFKELNKKFPNSNEANIARKKLSTF